MPSLNSIPPPDAFAKKFDIAIRLSIDESIEAVAEEAKAKVVAQIRGAVGDIASRVLKNFTFERFGQELVIRVQFFFPDDNKPKT